MNEKPTVLVIEDDQIMLTLTSKILKQAGFNVIAAGNGAEAVQQVASAHYDLVVTDLFMPYTSGFSLIEAVRSRTEESNIPVIVVTSFANDDTIHALSALDVAAILKKPLTAQGLVDVVTKVLAMPRVAQTVVS